MNNVSQPKVFEFAKEIGMETLALMDKIREWKLPVRSHMAELDPALLDEIKSRLTAETGSGKSSAKKKVVKKASPGGAAKKPVAKKVATRATVVAAAEPTLKDTAASAAGAKKPGVVIKKAAAKTVIRKKPDEIEAVAMEQAASEVEEVKAREISEPVVEVEHEEVETAHIPPVATSVAPQTAAPVAPPAPAVEEPIEVEEVVAPIVATQPEPAPEPEEPERKVIAPRPSLKREVVMTSSGPVSGVRSEAPRRNIVGRMDLSRVTPPPSSASGPGHGRPTIGRGPGSAGSTAPRGLRPGFVAPQPVQSFDGEIDSRKKTFEDKKGKSKFTAVGPVGPAGVGGVSVKERQLTEEQTQFSSTEFRKREMVFQPKKKKGSLNRESRKTELTTPKASKRVVKVDEAIKVVDFAIAMGVKAAAVVKSLMKMGTMATMNTALDFDTAALIAPEFGFEVLNVHKTVDEMLVSTSFGELDAEKILRSPVVTVMGHVDHGKTSLLDAIRKADVAAHEAGGITQHIGAYRVTTEDGHTITFIDTPGHEAFTAMRARGANVTDIAVIVVAADDGLMPQTAEAINHAKAAKVPIIVAINKMDKPGANPERIKQQLTEFELVPEEWGGDTIFVPVSALQKTGINELLEQIYLLAEVAELKANPKRSATGVVIESRMDKGRGCVATLLIKDGTLKIGDYFIAGLVEGRVRSLTNDKGERVTDAGPGVPVEVMGLPDSPLAGDKFDVVENEKAGEEIAGVRRAKKELENQPAAKMSMEALFAKMQQGDLKELPIVLKTDVSGSIEAIRGMFEKLGTSEVKIKLIHTAVGGISESDVLLASTAKGIIVGFNVRPDGGAIAMAKREGIEIKTYSIVYELVDEMKKAMGGLLAPEVRETALGRAEVRNTFTVPKIGMIAGCSVVDGKITRQAQLRLVRDGKIIYTGKLGSLKRFKDDVKEVASGYECGIGIENYNDVKVGDVIEAFSVESIVREL